MDYNNSYLGNNLNAWSQAGNAACGGKSSITISARIGEKNLAKDTPVPLFWRICEKIVDTTFYPVDGKYHCYKAYVSDAYEDFTWQSWKKGTLILLTIFLVSVCGLLAPIFWTYQLFKKK